MVRTLAVEQSDLQVLEHLLWQTAGDPRAAHPQVQHQDGPNQTLLVVMIPQCEDTGCHDQGLSEEEVCSALGSDMFDP